MADTRYISIIRLFDHLGIGYRKDVNVPRIRKQLAAEFAIAPEGIIEAEGFAYTKHDVLAEAERPDFGKRLSYHLRIWQDIPLLRLLEHNEISHLTLDYSMRNVGQDPEYGDIVRPRLVEPFLQISRSRIRELKLGALEELFRYEAFVLPEDREQAFRPVRLLIAESSRICRNVSKENYKKFRPQLLPWLQPGWAAFLNNIPDDLYAERAQLIADLINLTVRIQNVNIRDCKLVSRELVQLDRVMPENLRIIQSNHKAYMKKRSIPWGYLYGGLVLLRILVAAAGGCN